MTSVWIVESGEYEPRSIFAVFASREIATEYIAEHLPNEDEEPWEATLWERRPERVTSYRVQAIYNLHEPPHGTGWDHPSQGVHTKRESYATDEVHEPEPVSESRMAWWDGRRMGAVYVAVCGNDEAAVESEFARLWADVLAGVRPPAIAMTNA